MKKREYKIGDVVAVEFIKNHREGRKPVCMIEGMICFISRDYRGQFVHEQSMWHVEIIEIKDKVMIVNPVQEIKTKFENQRDIQIAMRKLQEKFSPKLAKKVKIVNTNAILETVPMVCHCIACNWEGHSDEIKDSTCPKCGAKGTVC